MVEILQVTEALAVKKQETTDTGITLHALKMFLHAHQSPESSPGSLQSSGKGLLTRWLA